MLLVRVIPRPVLGLSIDKDKTLGNSNLETLKKTMNSKSSTTGQKINSTLFRSNAATGTAAKFGAPTDSAGSHAPPGSLRHLIGDSP